MVVGSRPPAPEVTVRQGIGRGRAGDRYAIGDVPNRLAKRLALLAMCFGLFMAMLDNIIVNVALPSIQARFGASVSGLEWVVTAHTSPFACLLLTAGLIADAKGRSSCSWPDWRCSSAASAACALAPDMTRAGDRPVHCSVRQRRRCSPARCRSSGNGLFRQHPATLAQAFVTLDHLTEGRAILGVGSGERENTEPCGMPFVNRVSGLEEAPTIVRLLWESGGEPVGFDGKIWKLRDALFTTPLYQGQPPPIWVAAHGPRMLALTGRFGDGWTPTQKLTPQQYAAGLAAPRSA